MGLDKPVGVALGLPRRMPRRGHDQAREADTSDGGFVWIRPHEPDEPLLRTVQQRFGLPCRSCG